MYGWTKVIRQIEIFILGYLFFACFHLVFDLKSSSGEKILERNVYLGNF